VLADKSILESKDLLSDNRSGSPNVHGLRNQILVPTQNGELVYTPAAGSFLQKLLAEIPESGSHLLPACTRNFSIYSMSQLTGLVI
jgi:hypothetical protein